MCQVHKLNPKTNYRLQNYKIEKFNTRIILKVLKNSLKDIVIVIGNYNNLVILLLLLTNIFTSYKNLFIVIFNNYNTNPACIIVT